jgi:hypothetical protein
LYGAGLAVLPMLTLKAPIANFGDAKSVTFKTFAVTGDPPFTARPTAAAAPTVSGTVVVVIATVCGDVAKSGLAVIVKVADSPGGVNALGE